MKLRLLLVTLLALGAALPATAQNLWGKATYGMTVDQVKSTYPASVTPDGEGTLKSGAKELLTLNDVKLADRQFEAQFFFKDAKLVQVTLGLDEPLERGSAMAVFDNIRSALISKYGMPIKDEDKPGSIMTMKSSDWLAGKVNISLVYITIGENDTDPTINVAYRTSVAQTAENL